MVVDTEAALSYGLRQDALGRALVGADLLKSFQAGGHGLKDGIGPVDPGPAIT